MSEPPARPSLAGGIFVMLGIFGGLLIGSALGEPSIGLLAGLVVGIAAALIVWRLPR